MSLPTGKDPNLPDVGPNITAETLSALKRLLSEAQGSKNPEGPTPPQPPPPGKNADVTGARPLHSETTPARQLDIQPPVKPSVFSPRPMTTSSSSTGEQAMSDDMLETVSSYMMNTILHHSPATFTPSSNAMFAVLTQMDKTMSTTKRWLDNSFGWIPSYSRLYYGTLFIYSIMRAERDAGILNMGDLTMLENFERYFNPGNLLIAGPLVPIFKSISTSKIDSDLFGNVAPSLPKKTHMDTNNPVIPKSIDDNVFYHLPALPAIFDEICTAIHLGPGANDVYQTVLTRGATPGAFGLAFGQQTPNTNAYNQPGLAEGIALTMITVGNFYQCAPSYSFPPPMNNATISGGINNWFQYCRLATGDQDHHEWLSRLSGTMNTYAQFFRGSIPIGDISSSSLPTGQIAGRYRPKTLPTGEQEKMNVTAGSGSNPSTSYYYKRPEIKSRAADWVSYTMAIPTVEEWRALYSQINCLHNALVAAPPRQHRSGNFWTLPVVRRADNVNPSDSVPLLIARKFHRSNRDETL